MPLPELFVEGKNDAFFRQRAAKVFESVIDNATHVDVRIGEDQILAPNEVGYLVSRITETLDMMVVFTAAKNDRPSGHYYEAGSTSDYERAVLVLFVEEEPSNLIKRKLLASRGGLKDTVLAFKKVAARKYNTFVHEYIHHLDKMRMGPHTQSPHPTQNDSPDEKQRKWGEYYNSPLELNAYTQSMAAAIEKNVRKNPQNWPMDSQEFHSRAMSFIEKNFPLAWKYFDDDSKRRVQKRVMQMWLDLRGSG